MLTAIRGQHAKKILWIVAGTVITAFVLSNARYFLRKRQANIIAEIKGQKVVIPNFRHYIDLARLDFILYANSGNKTKTITPETIAEKAGIYYRLLWKVKEEGIDVSDKEVMLWIDRNFSRRGKFDQAFYQQYIKYISQNFGLTLTLRSFEEYLREMISIDKLWKKLIKVIVTDQEVRDAYTVENQKVKIAYLFIPYKKFRVDVGVKPNEIEEFYQNNKTLFQREPTINIEYALITKEDNMSPGEIGDLAKLKTLDELKRKTSLTIKETGFIKKGDSVKEAGWKQKITRTAFGLKINEISPPINLGQGFVIIGKKAERPAFTPSLGEIKAEVKEKLIVSRAEEEAKRFSSDLLKEINEKKITELGKFAKKKDVEFKETDFFKYHDYIDGIGLNNQVSAIAFSLSKGEFHPEIVALDKGAYVLQLKDKTSIDEEDFQTKRKGYYDKIEKRKLFIERLKFIATLEQEILVKLPSIK